MVSQRGIINLCHSDGQRDAYMRRGNAMHLNGVDAEWLDAEAVRALLPQFNYDNARFPIKGGLMQRRGGTVRHDAVAWGYARAASERGVDIIQHCEVTGLKIESGMVKGVETTLGPIEAGKVALAGAGHSSQLAAMAELRLPIESHVLQAFVSEAIKPVIDHVVTFGAGHFYVSQSDKGGLVFGGEGCGELSDFFACGDFGFAFEEFFAADVHGELRGRWDFEGFEGLVHFLVGDACFERAVLAVLHACGAELAG
jgi:sarcosine oxidase subunit beta